MNDPHDELNPFTSPLAAESPVAVSPDIDDAEAIRKEHISREASIRSVGILYYLSAVLMTTTVVLTSFAFLSQPVESFDSTAVLIGGATWLICALLAALTWWLARGLRRLNPTARPWVIGLSIFGLIASLAGINLIGLLINGYILWLMQGEKAKMVFSPDYKEVIAATPHVKYKTSLIVRIFVGILGALIVVALLFAILSATG